jgi:LPXTG-motif cell wall-anchored protein
LRNRDVTLTIFSDPVVLGTTGTNAAGNFSTGVVIPTTAALGPHTIVATGPSLANPAVPLTLSASITVVAATAAPAAAAPASHAALPITGWDTRGPLLGGLALLLLGTAVVLVTRSRRHRSHA